MSRVGLVIDDLPDESDAITAKSSLTREGEGTTDIFPHGEGGIRKPAKVQPAGGRFDHSLNIPLPPSR